MVQEQLTDYISSQLKLGVSREAIKSALVSAGWIAGDVEDTLKKVGGNAPGMSVSASQPLAATNMKPAQIGSPQTTSPQMIRVGDLVSSPFSGQAASQGKTISAASSPAMATAEKFGGTIKGNSFEVATAGSGAVVSPKKSGIGMMIIEIIAIILIFGFAALAWYFYSGNAALAAKVASLNSQSASVSSQLSALQAQITASSSADAAQMSQLQAENADLALNLSFYAIQPGTSTSTAQLPVTISGLVSGGGRAPYAITTSQGAKIFVANSSDATVAPELKAAIGQTVQLTGTYVEGSDEMTVSSVSAAAATN
jgi:hypothetical protein